MKKLISRLLILVGIGALAIPVCYTICFVVGHLAMSRGPLPNCEKELPDPRQPAVVFLVDVSGSMETPDMATSASNAVTRIAAVKHALADYVNAGPMRPVGLVSFTGFAATHALPGCSREEFLKQVEALHVSKVVFDSDDRVCNPDGAMTAIGDGMAAALSALRGVGTARERSIVLISDGFSNAGKLSAEDAFDMARASGVHVHTIGIKRFSLKDIADAAGERFTYVSDESSLRKALADTSRSSSDSAEKETEENPIDVTVVPLPPWTKETDDLTPDPRPPPFKQKVVKPEKEKKPEKKPEEKKPEKKPEMKRGDLMSKAKVIKGQPKPQKPEPKLKDTAKLSKVPAPPAPPAPPLPPDVKIPDSVRDFGKGTAAEDPLKNIDAKKMFEQGYRFGTCNPLAPSEEQRCFSLIRSAIDREWNKESFNWREGLRNIQVKLQLSADGKVRGFTVLSDSGDADVDRTVQNALTRLRDTKINGLTEQFLKKYPEVNVVMELALDSKKTEQHANVGGSGKGTAAEDPLKNIDPKKMFEQGYRYGSRNQLATSEEQLCLSLIKRAINREWDKESFNYHEGLRIIKVKLQLGAGGKVRGFTVLSGSGDADVDRTAQNALTRLRGTTINGLTEQFLKKYPEVDTDMEPTMGR